MNNHKAIIENNPSPKLVTCLKQLKKIMPGSSMLQCIAAATWWTGTQPNIPGLKTYTVNVLEKENK